MFGRIRYRFWQVWVGWRVRVSDAERIEVRRWLSPSAYALWERQAPRDQAHSLRVMRWLLPYAEDAVLLRAALLHDVGKSVCRLRVWHRALWVLVERVSFLRRFFVVPHGWRRPFWVLAEHSRLGADLARSVGCSEEVVWLIAHHQEAERRGGAEQERRLRLLRWADKQS